MKNLIRYFTAVGLSAALVLSMAGCGNSDGSDTAGSDAGISDAGIDTAGSGPDIADTDSKSGEAAAEETEAAAAETGFSELVDWTLYPVGDKPRVIVTTDGEADDMNSMRHMLLYANELDIAGLVYSSSTFHWQGDGEHKLSEITEDYLCKGLESDVEPGDLMSYRPQEEGWIEDVIQNEYAEDYKCLVQNDPEYPSPDELLAVVRIGNWEFEGDIREDTDGSDLIRETILDDVDQKVFVQSWGGFNTVARALISIHDEYGDTDQWDDIYRKVINKVVIENKEQDTTYKNYIADLYPDLVCLNGSGIQFGYYTSKNGEASYVDYFKAAWLKENIKFDHGALMSDYGLLGDGKYYEGEISEFQYGTDISCAGEGFEEYDWLGEGDSICWMVLTKTGLRGLETPNLGTWGGRLLINNVAENRSNSYEELDPNTNELANFSGKRWLPTIFEDWAARADWTTNAYEDCNHAPLVEAESTDLTAGAGEQVTMNATVTDPDGNDVAQNWWVYTYACEYDGDRDALALDASADGTAAFTVPEDAASGDYFTVILEAKDNADAPMTRYAEYVITVK